MCPRWPDAVVAHCSRSVAMVTPRRTARRHSAVGCTPQEPPIGHLGVPGLRTVETSLARVSRKLGVADRTWRGRPSGNPPGSRPEAWAWWARRPLCAGLAAAA